MERQQLKRREANRWTRDAGLSTFGQFVKKIIATSRNGDESGSDNSGISSPTLNEVVGSEDEENESEEDGNGDDNKDDTGEDGDDNDKNGDGDDEDDTDEEDNGDVRDDDDGDAPGTTSELSEPIVTTSGIIEPIITTSGLIEPKGTDSKLSEPKETVSEPPDTDARNARQGGGQSKRDSTDSTGVNQPPADTGVGGSSISQVGSSASQDATVQTSLDNESPDDVAGSQDGPSTSQENREQEGDGVDTPQNGSSEDQETSEHEGDGVGTSASVLSQESDSSQETGFPIDTTYQNSRASGLVESDSGNGSLPQGAVIGIVVAVLFIIFALLAFLAIRVIRRRKNAKPFSWNNSHYSDDIGNGPVSRNMQNASNLPPLSLNRPIGARIAHFAEPVENPPSPKFDYRPSVNFSTASASDVSEVRVFY
jgi:hypothetical protein